MMSKSPEKIKLSNLARDSEIRKLKLALKAALAERDEWRNNYHALLSSRAEKPAVLFRRLRSFLGER